MGKVGRGRREKVRRRRKVGCEGDNNFKISNLYSNKTIIVWLSTMQYINALLFFLCFFSFFFCLFVLFCFVCLFVCSVWRVMVN